ncbi:MAG: hypothetical protein HQL52_16165 [Magnetococcales bacterium]|nr:hypothetical protein [Magnetococcales bacterium]
MKQLDDIILPDSLQWIDRHQASSTAQSLDYTLAGNPVLFAQGLEKGRPITLEAAEEVTWLDQETVDALLDLANQAGATFSLNWEGEWLTVMFRHNEPPAVSLHPIWPHHTQFIGTIKLIQM